MTLETLDLRAFTTVFRAWNHLQPPPRIINSHTHSESQYSSPSHTTTTSSDLREDKSTVCSHRPIVDEQPSLGYLDEALKFIAAERERWAAQREAGATVAMLSGIEPRRKHWRKRNKTPHSQSTTYNLYSRHDCIRLR